MHFKAKYGLTMTWFSKKIEKHFTQDMLVSLKSFYILETSPYKTNPRFAPNI